MRILFIGPYSYGSTSKMRVDIMQNLYTGAEFTIIDTDIPFFNTSRVYRSLGFRYKIGPLIKNLNNYILKNILGKYDFCWIEKGVFITKPTIVILKRNTKTLIHYTPDPAFLYHHSNHFSDSIIFYDYCITTKSYEIDYYRQKKVKYLILITQGFDSSIHKPFSDFENKSGICFVGHYEKERADILQRLLDIKIDIKLAGIRWERFVKRNSSFNNLKYIGKQLDGLEYSKVISGSLFGLGFLSKWVPEKHTTRTFEIPACKTILITEKNEETGKFFKEDEVVFYDDSEELVMKIKTLIHKKDELKRMSEKGYNAVINGGYDYESILKKIFSEIGI